MKTGEEKMVIVEDNPTLSKSDFMHVIGTSSEDVVLNSIRQGVGTSVIAPRAMIVESMEKYLKKAKADKPFAIKNPLEK